MNNPELEDYIENSQEYTSDYERNKLKRDWYSKDGVAQKILEDFKKRAGEVEGKSLLDAGFGNGSFVVVFARAGAVVSGIEVNPVLLDIATVKIHKAMLKADLRLYDGNFFPFEDNVFDYVYSTSVLEHVSDSGLFLKEIDRVLKPGGRVYLSFPNRLAPRETHTGIFFLSYFPRSIGELILKKIFKRNTISELNLHFLSYLTLRRLLKGTRLRILFEYESVSPLRQDIKKILASVGLHQSAILKTVMVILKKDE